MQSSLTTARYVTLHEGEEPVAGFRLVRRRGRGGFGEVWEAEAPGGFLVALKFVRLSHPARTAELRALDFVRGIHHPNLLANFGSWVIDDTLIIGMELADGSLWDRHVEATQQGYRGIPRGELLGYLAEVAAGIDHLNDYRHTVDGRTSVGVQHRDLKPPNILLFGGGAKVADLGMARAMEGEVAGHTGNWTFSYAAPEFFRGETTRQSDQYSLASTFCQLRGGRLPFDGGAASVTAGHLFGQPDLDALPLAERPIVERALAKVPTDRWPSCREFVAALRSLPADAVDDVLIDPEGPSLCPHAARSWEDAGSGSGFMNTGWQQDSLSTGSTFYPAFAPPTPAPPTSVADSVPTLILPTLTPAVADPPAPAPPPRPSPRRRALAGAATAFVLAAIAGSLANHHHAPHAEPITRERAFTPADVAPPVAAPVLPVAVAAEAEATPAPPPTIASTEAEPVALLSPAPSPTKPVPLPLKAEPPVARAEVESRPAAAAVAVASPEGLDSGAADRSDLVLEGPIDMDVAPAATTVTSPAPPIAEPARPAAASVAVVVPRPAAAASTGGLARNVDPNRVNVEPNRAAAASSPAAPTAEAAFGRGRDFFRRNAFAEAAVEFDEAIRLNPTHVTSRLLRAIARHRAGNPRAALADYAEVIRARPDDVTAYISRGQAYHELEAYDRAIADYDEAIRRRPADGEIRFRRGLARFKAGDDAGAIPDFTESLRLERNNAYAPEFLAEALARRDLKLAQAARPAPAAPAEAAPANIREARYVAPPTTAAAAATNRPPPTTTPAARPAATPNPPDRRRTPVRRLLPWPFPKPK